MPLERLFFFLLDSLPLCSLPQCSLVACGRRRPTLGKDAPRCRQHLLSLRRWHAPGLLQKAHEHGLRLVLALGVVALLLSSNGVFITAQGLRTSSLTLLLPRLEAGDFATFLLLLHQDPQ